MGTLLFGLAEAGYDHKLLVGIDYSGDAVKLSKNVAQTRNASEVTFTECDFLVDDPPPVSSIESSTPLACWDLILDKGDLRCYSFGTKGMKRESLLQHIIQLVFLDSSSPAEFSSLHVRAVFKLDLAISSLIP